MTREFRRKRKPNKKEKKEENQQVITDEDYINTARNFTNIRDSKIVRVEGQKKRVSVPIRVKRFEGGARVNNFEVLDTDAAFEAQRRWAEIDKIQKKRKEALKRANREPT